MIICRAARQRLLIKINEYLKSALIHLKFFGRIFYLKIDSSIFADHKENKMFSLKSVISSLFMIIALLWLTVSTPFRICIANRLSKRKFRNRQGQTKNPFQPPQRKK